MSPDERPFVPRNVVKCDCKAEMPSNHILYLEDFIMNMNNGYTTDCGGIKHQVIENKNTELVFIIDRSGSMAGFESDTIGGFNSMIEEQKKGEGEVFVSTVLFNNFNEVIHDRVSIESIKPMTEEDYRARGGTALLDAIGGAIHHIGNIHKYARREDVPKNTIFVITTDGMENASRTYSSTRVKEMIKRQTEKYGWEFIFVAANIDAIETADRIGIRADRAANYRQSSEGFEACYSSIGEFVRTRRSCESIADDAAWKKRLEEID